MSVKGLVSDRAGALIKIGTADYLEVPSMPDLFHFCQDIGKGMGSKIGRVRRRAKDKLLLEKDKESEFTKRTFKKADDIYNSYRQEMEEINKTVHPFNEQNVWAKTEMIEEKLLLSFSLINLYAQELGIEVEKKKKEKVLKQIKPISEGIEYWITATKLELEELEEAGRINKLEEEWLRLYAMPCTYWKIQLRRTQAKERNRDLRTYYKQRVAVSEEKCRTEYLARKMSLERVKYLLKLADQIVITFQRSSSQVEGRNGYLSFINHAHRGIPKNRLKVLTVIHNYDIKRRDGTSPAQRLFDRKFPDLFEFLCENVTGFKEPRRRKSKPLSSSLVQP
jgi:hypothetical protein